MKLGIGTAQFGMRYGTSKAVQLSRSECRQIIALADSSNIHTVDTAAAYGESETVLGEILGGGDWRIVTKLAPLPQPCAGVADWVRNGFQMSLERLNRQSVDAVLIHAPGDLLGPHGPELWRSLLDLRSSGLVNKIGVSIYTSNEAKRIIDQFKIDLIQLPVNVFDQRLLKDGTLERLKESGVEVHARSLFYRGVLFQAPSQLVSGLKALRPILQEWHEFLRSHSLSVEQAVMAFVKSIPAVDCAIVGVHGLGQWERNILAYGSVSGVGRDVFERFAVSDESLLDPNRWAWQVGAPNAGEVSFKKHRAFR